MKYKNRLLLTALTIVLLLASFLRLWKLDQVPPELFGDEIDVGYQAYSLLKTGRDYYNQLLPLYIRSLTEERAPLLIYSTIPTIAIFGLNEYGVRMAPALWGISNIVIIFLLARILFESEKIALLSAVMLAFSPWHLHYSRASFEATILLGLILFGTYLYLLSNKKALLLSSLCFALTLYVYNTAFIFTPLFILLLLVIHRKKFSQVLLPLVLFLLITSPVLQKLISGHVSDRFRSISIFKDELFTFDITQDRLSGGTKLEKLFHNRITAITSQFTTNYLRSFSTEFLYIKGDNIFRHSTHTGELMWVQIIVFPAGLFYLLFKRTKASALLLGWLLIAPLPASLTYDGAYHATRLFIMLGPISIISGFGLSQLINSFTNQRHKAIFAFGVTILFVTNTGFYLHEYFSHYPKESWRWWHYGYKDAVQEIVKLSPSYDRIFINNSYEPALLRLLFWSKFDPGYFHRIFQSDKSIANITPGFDGMKLDKYYIGGINDITAKSGGIKSLINNKDLYLVSQEKEVGGDWDWRKSPPSNIKVIYTTTNPLGEPIFYLVTGE